MKLRTVLLALFLFASNNYVIASLQPEEILKQCKEVHAHPIALCEQDRERLGNILARPSQEYTDLEFLAIMQLILEKSTNSCGSLLEDIATNHEILKKQLTNLRASGIGFALHTNSTLFYGRKEFNITLAFKDTENTIRQRKFEIAISNLGLKVEKALHGTLVFVVGNDFNYLTSAEPIALGRGIEFGLRVPFLPKLSIAPFFFPFKPLTTINFFTVWISYVPFQKLAGGLLMLHFSLGVNPTLLDVPAQLLGLLRPGKLAMGAAAAINHASPSLVLRGGFIKPRR